MMMSGLVIAPNLPDFSKSSSFTPSSTPARTSMGMLTINPEHAVEIEVVDVVAIVEGDLLAAINLAVKAIGFALFV